MSEEPDATSGVWKTLPRRPKLLHTTSGFEHPPQMTVLTFEAGMLRTFGRILRCLYGAAYYVLWRLFDALLRRDTEERGAVHFRRAIERVGGTFIKLGQQLSLRADMLPYAYCTELVKLLDDVEPFGVRVVVKAFHDTCGKKVEDIFSAFDPDPVGSASIACVFQARLKDGTDVAVKVRRPGIGDVFAADFRALDWVAHILEFLTILRPGFSDGIRKGLRSTVMEEMDFRREARYQELFRRSAKRRKKAFITAPRVFTEYSGENVIVMELVTEGMKLSEVLAAVDQPAQNAELAAVMSELHIKPRIVARRLLWANYAGMITDMFFHGDPSPGNIFVQKKSRLVFIDFGSCGSFNQSQRRALKQINHHQALRDAEGMATASLALLEPLPPVDIDAFSDELEALYQTSLYAMESREAKWWERTTAVQWYQFLAAALKFRIPLPPVVLRMARATLLYDTVAARLDNEIVFYDEYRRYERFAMKLRGREIREDLHRQLAEGLDDQHYVTLEKLAQTGNRVIYQLERFIDLQPFKFISDINKGAFALLAVVKLALTIGAITILAIGTTSAVASIVGHHFVLNLVLVKAVVTNKWYLLVVGAMGLTTIRRILFRMGDKDIFKV